MKKILGLLLFTMISFLGIQAAEAQTLPDGTYTIQSALKENMVIDLYGGQTTNNTNIQLFNNNGGDNQKWVIKHVGDGYYTIASYINNNQVMDVHGGGKTKGTNVELFKYNGGDNQKWLLKDAGNGYYYLVSKCNNLYLDVYGGYTTNGTNIHVWTNNGGNGQKFKFVSVESETPPITPEEPDDSVTLNNGYYTIQSALNNDKVISSVSDNIKNGTNVVLKTNTNSNSQKWQVTNLGNGYYKITSALNINMSLDVYSGIAKAGANIQLYQYHDSDGQKWLLKDAGDGYYYIVSKGSNYQIDIYNNETADGTNVQLWNPGQGNNQKFKFVKTTIEEEKPATLEDGTYTIQSALNNDKVISSVSDNIKNGTNVVLKTNTNSDSQKWQVTNLGNGYYKITSALNDAMALDVYGGTAKAGINVQLYQYHDSDGQKWLLKDAGDGYYYIVSKGSNYQIDIYNNETVDGTNVQLWNPGQGNNQKFKFVKSEIEHADLADGYYTIQSALNDNKVVSVISENAKNGTNVVLKTNINRNNQKWKVTNLGNGYYKITSALNDDMALDVYGGIAKAGANVQLYQYHDSDGQKWLLKDAGDGYYYIVSKGSNYQLDVYNSELTDGTNVQLWNPGQGNNQKFKFVSTDISDETNQQLIKDGYYTIQSALNTSKSLDVPGGIKANGTNVQLYDSNNELWQTWYFKYLNNGYYAITSAMNPEIALDVYGNSTSNNTNVDIYKYSGADNQQWLLKDAGDGYFYIIAKNSGLNLETASADNGANIRVNQSTSSNNQKFKLIENTGEKIYTGIDVSYYQKDIDWQQVSNSGVGFVIIRAGYGGDWTNQDDAKLAEYVAACEKYNIPYGLYLYSYASEIDNSDTSAQAEARHMLRLLNTLKSYNYEPNLGTKVFIDMEDGSVVNAGKDKLTAVSDTFCSIIESNGYSCGVYANRTWLTNHLNAPELAKKYDIWLAEYLPVVSPTFNYAKTQTPIYNLTEIKYWQFASDGKINGISGNVDMDLGYNIFD